MLVLRPEKQNRVKSLQWTWEAEKKEKTMRQSCSAIKSVKVLHTENKVFLTSVTTGSPACLCVVSSLFLKGIQQCASLSHSLTYTELQTVSLLGKAQSGSKTTQSKETHTSLLNILINLILNLQI